MINQKLNIILRYALITIFLFIFKYIFDTNSNFLLQTLALILSAISFNFIYNKNKSFLKTILLGFLCFILGTKLIIYLIPSLTLVAFFDKYFELVNIYFITLTFSFLIRNFSFFNILEVLLYNSIIVASLSTHRNFNFINKIINSTSWELNLTPFKLILYFGTFIFVVSFILILNSKQIFKNKLNNFNLKKLFFLSSFFIFISFLSFNYINKIFYEDFKKSSANGVGSADEEGVSPLDFNLPGGKSSEPMALVRLNNNYPLNPESPMIYFRESALSGLDGSKFIRNSKFNPDIAWNHPQTSYIRNDDNKNILNRVEVVQSIFLLTNHNLSFSLDYPIKITPLEVTNTKKFVSAYKAHSIARSYDSKFIYSFIKKDGFKLGDGLTKEELEHFTMLPENSLEYINFAKKIIQKKNKVINLFEITKFFNKNAIYTLTPEHDPNLDPVEAFLFGNLKGFCVHFAHANALLFRSLGIPSRVATGYASDFSQSSDGHILLRVNDRHAWSEVYFDKLGWVPFDISPEQVDNHADTPIDMNILKELISQLDSEYSEIKDQNKDLINNINLSSFNPLKILSLILLLIYLFKLYNMNSCLFTKKNKLKKAYKNLVYRLKLLGFTRQEGMTKLEFQNKLKIETSKKLLLLTQDINLKEYNNKSVNVQEIRSIIKGDFNKLKEFSFIKRLIAFLNPFNT